mgnify:CR=1 FL=1
MSVTTVSSSMITDATILNADIGAAAAIATTKLGAGAIVQVVNVTTGAVATGTTVLANDNSIPQKTEGVEFMTLAITPTNSSNKLLIECVYYISASTATFLIGALFQDATAGALAAGNNITDGNAQANVNSFTHFMAAGTTSETTFKLRVGTSSAATITFNGVAAGREMGGVAASSITITEIKV